ncbi:unnamed protein product [Pedinophyceae sp. YPF-701]|nr:unnamed protein product [Pedinophyceae sp. YPF-701]
MRNIMEQRMMSAMQQAVRDADALVAIIDASKTPKEDFFILEPGVAMGLPVCVVLNKMDQVPPQEVAPMVDWFEATSNASSVLPVSALTGENLAELRAWVHGALPPGPAMYPEGDVSTASERFFVSEIIRERIYEQYDQEIPYMCTVNIVQFKERSRGKDLIVADVIVEQARHKGILVGRKGSAIKRLSASARLDIETFLGRPVYLELSVKEQKGWRDNDSSLERMGY